MKVGILRFPGSNCDFDTLHAFKDVLAVDAELVWHKETTLEGYTAIVVPGGFSYGDYLRCGAIARFSPVMKSLVEFANAGGPVLGICNGFQVLCESGLLPGALIRNNCLEFRCLTQTLKVGNASAPFDAASLGTSELNLPIAHGEGNYRIDEDGLAKLEANNQVVLRYEGNPNGSLNDIAGIRNEAGNVIGMMPHPERALESIHPTQDGLPILKAFLELASVNA